MRMRRPGILSGSFVAAMLAASLIGIFFFAWKLAGLPFVPFDMFDWLTRVLPGRLIAFGIGTMVTFIRALNLGPRAYRRDREDGRTGNGHSLSVHSLRSRRHHSPPDSSHHAQRTWAYRRIDTRSCLGHSSDAHQPARE